MVLTTQQWLNATYGNDARYVTIGEDGYTGSKTINAMIRALQIELGITATADSFGAGTISKFKEKFPNEIVEQAADATSEDNIYGIIQGSLWCKGYSTGSSSITKHFYAGTGSAIKRLKEGMGLNTPNSMVTLNVMKGLLSMDQYVVMTLQGGTTKIQSIQQLFQESATDITYFSPERGKQDAILAVSAARKFNIPINSVIFFATDLNPLDGQIKSYILPCFASLKANFDPFYQIGIYGTRNACTQVCDAGHAVTSFVSDMSIAYSGNMGYKMPSGWIYDQFSEISMGSDWAIDKTAYSGAFPAVSVLNNGATYVQPAKKVLPEGSKSIFDLLPQLEQLEQLYYTYHRNEFGFDPPNVLLTTGVTNYLRSLNYASGSWWVSTTKPIDWKFVQHVESNAKELADFLAPYVAQGSAQLMTDGADGVLELPHLAATTECYAEAAPVPDFWAGWGGDLASAMDQTHQFLANNPLVPLQEAANQFVGIADGHFNDSDMCMDADAITIAGLVKDAELDSQAFTKSLRNYYTRVQKDRYDTYSKDIGSNHTLTDLNAKISTKMNATLEQALLAQFAGGASDEIIQACCNSFAHYIAIELN